VTVNPPSQSVEIKHAAMFTATVSGVGKDNFTYQWRHNGKVIKGETGETLTIDSVEEDDHGTYHCVVENEYKDCAKSNNAELSKL